MRNVQLRVGANIYSGWKEIAIRRSMDIFANSFDLVLTDNEAGEARSLKLGIECDVRIDGETVITGYIDRIVPSYNSQSRSLTISGRSKTGDLVDCAIPPTDLKRSEFKDQTLAAIAKPLCEKFGISVSTDLTLSAIAASRIDDDETVFEFLDTLSRQVGVRLMTDASGNLLITQASDTKISTALVLGENILEASGEFNHRSRFSDYVVVGEQSAWGSDTSSSTHVTGNATDTIVRYRPTVIHAESATELANAKQRAEFQRNVNYGRSRQVTYTINGWSHADGLWQPNTNVNVIDDWIGFDNDWLMIGSVEYLLNEKGERTRLTVMPKEAYDMIAIPTDDDLGAW